MGWPKGKPRGPRKPKGAPPGDGWPVVREVPRETVICVPVSSDGNLGGAYEGVQQVVSDVRRLSQFELEKPQAAILPEAFKGRRRSPKR